MIEDMVEDTIERFEWMETDGDEWMADQGDILIHKRLEDGRRHV